MNGEAASILIVDGDEFVQLARASLLRDDALVRVDSASTLAEAHAYLRTHAPALVLAELELPDGAGLELLADRGAYPLIILTAVREGDGAVEAMKAGAWDVREKTPTLAQRLPYLLTRWQEEWDNAQARRIHSEKLTGHVQARTLELEQANRRLEAEIAQRRAAEERLSKYQRLWERAERSAQLGSWYSDLRADGQLIWSPGVYRIFGVREDQFDNHMESLFALIHPDDRERVAKASQDAIAGIQPYQLEHRVRQPNGSVRLVMEQGEVVRDEQGQPLEMIGICWDITERRRAEDLLKNFFDLSLDLFCVANVEGYFTQVNPAFERLLGYSPQELTKRPFFDFVHPDDLERTHQQLQNIIAGGPVLDFTNRYMCKDGTHRWLSWRATPTVDGLTYAVARDITGQRSAEEALRESESRFRQLADNIRDVFWIVDLATKQVIYVSPAFEEIWDQPIATLYEDRLAWMRKMHPQDRPEVEAIYSRSLQEQRFESQYRLVDNQGNIRWIHDRGFAVMDNHGRPHRMVGIAQDITEHKKVEEARFIRKVAEALPHIMFVYNLQQQHLDFINRPRSLDLGYTSEQSLAIEANPFQLFHPDDAKNLPALQARWADAADGEILKVEFRMCDAEGVYRWFQSHETVFSRSSDGRVLQTLGVTLEITAAKLAEEQIRRALHEKEVLLREVHHRVKNNLQIVSSLVNLQAGHVKEPHALHLFDETRHRIRTMALLHETLYQTEDFAKVDFPQYVANLARYLFRSYGVDTNRVSLELDIAEVNFSLERAIPCGLIVNELISNALKYAFPAETTGALVVRLEALDEAHYRLTVKDNGVGVPPDFDLERTSSLGLQLVHDLVHQLRGEIHLETGNGLTVSIIFFA